MKNRTCGKCKHYLAKMFHCQKHDVMAESHQTCEDFEPKHKPTNGDRIRSMSDEELVKVIWKGLCGLCPYKGSGNICNNDTDKECHEIILEELNKEVENDCKI